MQIFGEQVVLGFKLELVCYLFSFLESMVTGSCTIARAAPTMHTIRPCCVIVSTTLVSLMFLFSYNKPEFTCA